MALVGLGWEKNRPSWGLADWLGLSLAIFDKKIKSKINRSNLDQQIKIKSKACIICDIHYLSIICIKLRNKMKILTYRLTKM